MSKYIDIHAHVNFKAYDNDRDVVIRRALESDTWVINIGTQYDTSEKAVEMTNEYENGVYATIGLHPIHTGASYHDLAELGEGGKEFTSRGEVFDKEKYRKLAQKGKVVAIGECGLDYYHLDQESIEKQKKAFISQIKLASELDLPLMLHIRNNLDDKSHNAYFDVCELLKKYSKRKIKGVSHFFAGSVEDMKRFVDIGVYISLAGPITYKPNLKICDYDAVIKETPLDMILTDTDSPYVAPVPYRGQRNEPVYVKEMVKKIAYVKNMEEDEVAKIIFSNAKKLFNL
jgi:TatD DNase family protein